MCKVFARVFRACTAVNLEHISFSVTLSILVSSRHLLDDGCVALFFKSWSQTEEAGFIGAFTLARLEKCDTDYSDLLLKLTVKF